MKVLVIGGGGREHAIVWALSQSRRAGELVCAPGNGGIRTLARCVPVDVADAAAIVALAHAEQPDLVVVGPEVPLAAGAVDQLLAGGFRTFGPTRAAAQLESSKAFAKDFMGRWGIPTAAYAVCRTLAEVDAALPRFAQALVVKADGLAAGKGVVLCESHDEARAAASAMLRGELLGSVAEALVLEEMFTGPEVSFFAIADGTRAVTLAAAQDHKRVGEGDTGPNTGGMGAYSTDSLLTAEQAEWLLTHVAQRVVDGMRSEGAPFVGVLFIGAMLTADGPRVLEFNTRFGDPETEAILLRLETDLASLLEAAAEGRVADVPVRLRPGASACVIAASGGYPGRVTAGQVIHGLESVEPDVVVFHAGTALRTASAQAAEALVTAGGRVLAVSAAAPDLAAALAKVYSALEGIGFEGMHFRRDIGWRALGAKP